MRLFGKSYSVHRSVHVKWRVVTHSDHSCCGRVSEGLWCCNLICLSCKVKAFIISARGIRCHLHWTWHVRTLLLPQETACARTHTNTGKFTHTSQTMGDKVEKWRLWGSDGQKDSELMVDGKAKVSLAWVCHGGQGDWSCWKQRDTHIHAHRANGNWLRSVVQQGWESDDENEGDWWDCVCVSVSLYVKCHLFFSSSQASS